MKQSWIRNGTVLIRVSANHFAFFRGYLEGVELATLARHYLGAGVTADSEVLAAKSTLKWIRAQLMVAAQRRGNFPEARLILIEPEKLRQSPRRSMPSLDEFREQRDPHELYSEAELIELFHETYGQPMDEDRRSMRNERLRRRQLDALATFEKLLHIPPALPDGVAGWLDPVLAERLHHAGIVSLHDLVTTINDKGYRWWVSIARFGEKAATQVVTWLKTESVEKSLGLPLNIRATTKARSIPLNSLVASRQPQTAVVPLEYLVLPAQLNGANGLNRGAFCSLPLQNDMEAIWAWLQRKPEGGSTWRSYRKEAERFLLWAIFERHCALSSLSAEDCKAYRLFLGSLQHHDTEGWSHRLARSSWCGARDKERWHLSWRPFEGPLSIKSQNLAFTILNSLCRWLVQIGYLSTNPWQGISKRIPVTTRAGKARRFSEMHWTVIQQYLSTLSDNESNARLRFILSICKETEIHLQDLLSAKITYFKSVVSSTDLSEQWHFFVGDHKEKKIKISAAVIKDLKIYLATRGITTFPLTADGPALLTRISNPASSISRNQSQLPLSSPALYQIIKKFLNEVANFYESRSISLHLQKSEYLGELTNNLSMANEIRTANSRWL